MYVVWEFKQCTSANPKDSLLNVGMDYHLCVNLVWFERECKCEYYHSACCCVLEKQTGMKSHGLVCTLDETPLCDIVAQG